jgi:hypothetical protein
MATRTTTSEIKNPIRFGNTGWSNDINDYIFIERIGAHSRPPPNAHTKWYGSNAAVYRVRLIDDAITRCIINGVPKDECNRDFVVKIIYNCNEDKISDDTLAQQVYIYISFNSIGFFCLFSSI